MNVEKDMESFLEMEEFRQNITPKQAKILQAAIELFSEKGYAATPTSEIAQRAGVAEGTIFRYYKTKKDLLMGLVTPLLTKFVAPFFMSQLVKDVFLDDYDSYRGLVEKLLRNRFAFVQKNKALLKIVLQELAFHPEIQQTVQQTFKNEVYPKFIAAIQRYQQKGEIVTEPPETVIRMTITTLMGFLITRFFVLPDVDWDDEAEIQRTIDFLIKGLSPS